jgi:hypothetical protein
MSHLEIILPFCIPPASLAADLLRELQTPVFAKLIALSTQSEIQTTADFARLLPHESWLAGHFSPESHASNAHSDSKKTETRLNSPASTHRKMHEFALTPATGFWFTFNPVHIHVARDHLVLTDPRRLELSEAESRALYAAAAPMCDELGKTLLYGDAKNWFLRADDWQALQTSTPDAACGHNIDIWMAKGEQELSWRKLQNEIQMLWHIHDVNAQRELQGKNSVNSAWLHGGSTELVPSVQIYTSSDNIGQVLAATSTQVKTTLVLDLLLEPALNNDWGSWLDAMHTLEKDWFAPIMQALRSNHINRLSLITTDARKIAQFTLKPSSLWKLWTKPSLNKLFSIDAP